MTETRNTFPALRCRMGDWMYYLTYMKFSHVDHWIRKTDEIHASEQLRDMIQREISNRTESIVDYLTTQRERFFNAIVVGLYEGSPEWYPIEVRTRLVHENFNIDEDARNSIGLLVLNGDEKIFAIDGQHRVVAIKEAIQECADLKDEDLAVIFVSHGTTNEEKKRTRRLFSTLNKYAKKVSPGEIVALDEDDLFAIVTRRLVEEFDFLKSGFKNESGFVYFGKQPSLRSSDKKNITTILTLYAISESLFVPFKATIVREKLGDTSRKTALNRLKSKRPDDNMIDTVYEQQVDFWTCLRDRIPAYAEIFNSVPEKNIADKYRRTNLHLMFRPAGQIAMARATRVMMDRGESMEGALNILTQVPMKLKEEPWRNVLWNPGTKTINNRASKTLVENLLLHMVGHSPRTASYDLLGKYRAILDDLEADLPTPII